jgi:hypothetical protein
MEVKITEEEMREINWHYKQAEFGSECEEASQYRDRWRQVIGDELQRMHEEGIDPYIAWLSVSNATDLFGRSVLEDLRPD